MKLNKKDVRNYITEIHVSPITVGLSQHASAISSLIVADWPLHYIIIQNFKWFSSHWNVNDATCVNSLPGWTFHCLLPTTINAVKCYKLTNHWLLHQLLKIRRWQSRGCISTLTTPPSQRDTSSPRLYPADMTPDLSQFHGLSCIFRHLWLLRRRR